MSGLFIYTSNYLERLCDQLAEVVSTPLENPLATEIIAVHSKGMERWVSMELARRNGICANVRYPYPNALMRLLFEPIIAIDEPDAAKTDFFSPEIMTFAFMKYLRSPEHRESLPEIKRYLTDDDSDMKLFQLSERLAQTFDRYLIFRPDLIFRWEKGGEDHWQARLWRAISSGRQNMHIAGLRKKFFQGIASGFEAITKLPPRISVFGTSYLPPFHLEVLAAVSKLISVHFFIINPCREYWSDIVAESQAIKIKGRYGAEDVSAQDLFLDQGNPLLSSMGALGKEFFKAVGDLEGDEAELFCDPEQDSVLAQIQSDILNLRDRTLMSRPVPQDVHQSEEHKAMVGISIHSCHSPMREIEVLHDQLLDMLAKDPAMVPGDIVVMTPDIDAYAPLIKAVFGAQTDERLKIPFSIADQGSQGGHPMISCFWSMLDLVDSRMGVSQVMGILQSHGVKEKFGLKDADIPVIEQWLKETNIRWGIDAAHREKLGLPGSSENTWKSGIDRLLLGYAMPGDRPALFTGILACDPIEGGDAGILGEFLEFKTRLFDAVGKLSGEKTIAAWTSVFREMIDGFFAADESTEIERQILGRAFDCMSMAQEASGMDQEIALPAIRSWLKNYLTREKAGGGFISRGITFCAMLPFRSIPAKIICLIGMNSDAFPRDHHVAGFDLMAADPRPGDRNGRNDDKYLFLQALLSARKNLHISFIGQSNRDNTVIPPSVLVQELMDYMVKGFDISENAIMVKHRLQSFSEAYFDGEGPLFSYSKEDFAACLAARDRLQDGQAQRVFLDQPLPMPDDAFKSIDIDALGLFFSNPCKYLLNRRLGLFLEDELPAFEEREVFVPDGLSRYQIGQDLVSKRFRDLDVEKQYAIQRATGRIPHGAMGEVVFYEMLADARTFNEKVFSRQAGRSYEKRDICLNIDDFTISGELSDLSESELLQTVYAPLKPKYLMRSWIRHLVLCAMEKKGFPDRTILVGKDSTWIFSPVPESKEILKALLLLYLRGLSEPLAFFPETSFAYAGWRAVAQKTEAELLRGVLEKWAGNDFVPGESEDPYYQLCFPPKRFEEAVGEKLFQNTAMLVCSPLLEHGRKIKEG